MGRWRKSVKKSTELRGVNKLHAKKAQEKCHSANTLCSSTCDILRFLCRIPGPMTEVEKAYEPWQVEDHWNAWGSPFRNIFAAGLPGAPGVRVGILDQRILVDGFGDSIHPLQ